MHYRMSSVRKDVEDCFGILKRRFRILRVPSMFFHEKHITNSFKTCCILHNMLLDWDDLGSTGQEDDDWISQDRSDLTTMLEDMKKRREELKRARNPNYRGSPANPIDEVSCNCTPCHAPYLMHGTDHVVVYSIIDRLQIQQGIPSCGRLKMTLAGLEA